MFHTQCHRNKNPRRTNSEPQLDRLPSVRHSRISSCLVNADSTESVNNYYSIYQNRPMRGGCIINIESALRGEDLREFYLVHRVVSHGAVVVRLRAVITAVYSHAVSCHVLRSSGWRRRHHRRRGALAGTAHAVWRCSCKSCCRNNRGAYKIRGCVFLSATAIICLSVPRALMLLSFSKVTYIRQRISQWFFPFILFTFSLNYIARKYIIKIRRCYLLVLWIKFR